MSRKKVNIKLYIIILFIAFILLYIYQKYYGKIDIEIASLSDMEDIIEVNGIIAKDEYVIKAPSSGKTKCYYNEGEKVYKYLGIADLAISLNITEIDNEIAIINKELENRKNSQQSVITIGSTEKGKYSSYTEDELKSLMSNLEESKTTNTIKFYSPASGLISYTFDGLENLVMFDNVNDITPEMFDEITFKEANYTDLTRSVNNGDPIVKVINNFFYYIVCKVPNNQMDNIKENSYIKTRFNDDDANVYGYINKINKGDTDSILIISFSDFFYKIYNNRSINLNLITDEYEGIKIRKSALIECNGLKGVYVKDISDIIKFFPVEILGSDDEYYIVSQGDAVASGKRGTITIDDSIYSTVKAYDKVVLDTDRVYDGQIVD